MAASAVYAKICGAGGTPATQATVAFSNIGTTTAPFHLAQGRYAVQVAATGFGTVTLEILMPDGSTYLNALTAAFSANGMQVADLPDGMYKFVIG